MLMATYIESLLKLVSPEWVECMDEMEAIQHSIFNNPNRLPAEAHESIMQGLRERGVFQKITMYSIHPAPNGITRTEVCLGDYEARVMMQNGGVTKRIAGLHVPKRFVIDKSTPTSGGTSWYMVWEKRNCIMPLGPRGRGTPDFWEAMVAGINNKLGG